MLDYPATMPGSFLPDHDLAATNRSTATPSFYMPPSPSASSMLSQSFTSIPRPVSRGKHGRKRPRLETRGSLSSTPRTSYQRTNPHTPYSLDAPSPAPLVNSTYRIAGGLDTPTAEKVRHDEQHQYDYEQDLRPNRFNVFQQSDSYFPRTPSSADVASRQRRVPPSPRSGWGKTVWTLTGGVAGKVINFCWSTAFRGFHSGGGTGYNMALDTPMVTVDGLGTMHGETVFDEPVRQQSPIPGGFPEENFIEDYMLRPESHQGDQTPTQLNDTGGGSSMKSTWVMVDRRDDDSDRSPVRKRARQCGAPTTPRPISRASTVRPRLHPPQSSHGASYASPRGSFLGGIHSRPQSSDGPERQHTRSKSLLASPRRSDTATPTSPDVIKFQKKQRRLDQKQDSSIQRLNLQMQDMIREAEQALGSKVEVYDEVDDEGYEEGSEASNNSGWSSAY